MFGYIKKKEVLRIIENGQKQLRDKEIDIVLNSTPLTDLERQHFNEAINKLRGGVHCLECLKKHFK